MNFITNLIARLRKPGIDVAQTPTSEEPQWKIARISNSEVFIVIKPMPRRDALVLSAADGSIFHSSLESAQAAMELGPSPIFLDGIRTDLYWSLSTDKQMLSNDSYERGYALFLHTRGADRRYGNIYMMVETTDLHAKIAVVPGSYHDVDNEAWRNAETVRKSELFDRLTELWGQLMEPERILHISKRYMR